MSGFEDRARGLSGSRSTSQQREAESLATDLDARIAELEDEVARRTSDDGVRREALCFGPYVEPGTEVYAVMGLEGCVSQPQDP